MLLAVEVIWEPGVKLIACSSGPCERTLEEEVDLIFAAAWLSTDRQEQDWESLHAGFCWAPYKRACNKIRWNDQCIHNIDIHPHSHLFGADQPICGLWSIWCTFDVYLHSPPAPHIDLFGSPACEVNSYLGFAGLLGNQIANSVWSHCFKKCMSSFSRRGCLRILLVRYCSELFLGFERLQRQRVRDHFLWFWSHACLLEKIAHRYWFQYLGYCLYSKWENVSLNDFEIDSLALQKGRSTNQHPYTKPSKCEQWREERCGQTLQGMWMSMKPRIFCKIKCEWKWNKPKSTTMLQDIKNEIHSTGACTFSFMTTTHTLAHAIEDKAVFAYC